jgi:hypothetical protein
VPSRLVALATRKGGERVVEVEQWAELRREHFVAGKVDQAVGARDRFIEEHDPAGVEK